MLCHSFVGSVGECGGGRRDERETESIPKDGEAEVNQHICSAACDAEDARWWDCWELVFIH